MNKSEDQIKSGGSLESSDTSHCVYVSSGKHSSVKKGAALFNCNVNICLTQKKDVTAGVDEVVEEAKCTITYQKRKRLKMTQLSDLSTNDIEITEEDGGSPSHGLPHRAGTTPLDQSVEIESLTPCCYQSMSEKRMTAEDRISVEVIDTNKLMEKDLDCDLGCNETSSNNVDNVLIENSNENVSENCDTLTLTESGSGNATVLKPVPLEMENDDITGLDSSDAYCSDIPPHLNDKELSCPVSSDATIINKNSCDVDMLANNLLEEAHHEDRKDVSNIEAHMVELKVEENISNFPRASSCDALGWDTPRQPEEQSVAPDADISLKQSDSLKGLTSQVVNERVNVAVERAFAVDTGKKLLVLDVNGLLVDISSYVPYDYDPDDIIMKKAVFKRTKRNMEPILDFLLGNDKCKLLFCWDQSHCTNTGFTTVEKRHKPLLLKKLKKLWDKCEPDLPWERGVYNESNTLLLDDTPSKALSNPQYNAVFPCTYRFRNVRDNSLGPGGDLRVYLDGLATAEHVQEYVKQNPFGQRSITEKNLSWGFYRKVIEASSTPPHQAGEDDS
ncbi:hypothetical protein OROHE_007951 [Orobanche hederae]